MPDGRAGVFDGNLLPLDVILAAVQPVACCPKTGAHGLWRGAAPTRPATGQNLPAVSLEADVPENPRLVQAHHLQKALALFARHFGELVFEGAADHRLKQSVIRHAGHVLGQDVLAVPHDGDAVAQLKQLLQLVGHEEDCNALVPELSDGRHQLADLLLAQRRCRLVHDDELGVLGHRLGDFDHLLKADAQLAALFSGIDLGMTQKRQRLPGFPVHSRILEQPQPVFICAP